MELLELHQTKVVIEYLRSNKCQILETLDSGNVRKSKDLFLTIEHLINKRILFFEIPALSYQSLDTIFSYDIVSDIYNKLN